jgi:hypothetical protein
VISELHLLGDFVNDAEDESNQEGGERWTVFDVLNSWSTRVYRLHEYSHARMQLEWSPDDYTIVLWARQNIEDSITYLGVVGEQVRELSFLILADRMFEAVTMEDPGGIVASWLGEPLPSDGWWWKRIPRIGPLHDEMLA